MKGNIVPVRKDNSYVIEKIDNGTSTRETKVLKRVNLVDERGEPKRIKWGDYTQMETSPRSTSNLTSPTSPDTPVLVSSQAADDKGSKKGEKSNTQKPFESILKTNQEESKDDTITISTNLRTKMHSNSKDQNPIQGTSKTESESVAEHKDKPTIHAIKPISQLQATAAIPTETSSSLLSSAKSTAADTSKQQLGLSSHEIQQKLLKIFTERDMQKIPGDYRSRTLERIKLKSPRRFTTLPNKQNMMRQKKLREKLDSLKYREPAQKIMSMEQLEDDWDSLTEVLATAKPTSSELALKIKSDSTTIPTEADASNGQKSNGLSLHFLSDLNRVITWNRQNRTGILPNATLTLERNEFGMLELNNEENSRGLKRSESPKIRGRGRKRAEPAKLLCNHSGFEECFNTIIMNLNREFWINETTPAEHYSQELKDIVRLCIQKQGQKCSQVLPSDIRTAMAESGLLKKTMPVYTTKFDWESYLAKWKATRNSALYPAPLKFFFNPIPKYTNPFEIGHKLEAIDPLNCSKFCVCSVVEVCGFRIKLHMDGYNQIYDFWVNANSTEIFPVGWCDKSARKLHLPFGSSANSKFSWTEYLRTTKSVAAPEKCFPHMQTLVSSTSTLQFRRIIINLWFSLSLQNTERNPFKVDMKLEADCVKNSRKLCVATIGDINDNRVLVTFDGLDQSLNYWTDINSPYLHPVNWHQRNGRQLSLPSGNYIRFYTI